jgi:EDD domain protein, DegV family
MKAYQIFSDSSCDLPDRLIDQYHIRIIPFYISFDQNTYLKENIDITREVFYEKLMAQADHFVTSMPTVQDYIAAFRQTLNNGQDIICLCLSHKLSGSYQSAVQAKLLLEDQYPDAEILVIDSIQATAGQGILLLQIACMKEAGLTLQEISNKLERMKPTARIMFTVETLEYLTKGRRIGKAAALAGDVLETNPLLQLKGAELVPYSKTRGRRQSLDQIFSMTEEYFIETGENPGEYDFAIADATTPEDALYLQKRIEEMSGHHITYPVFRIGVTIGSYTGPGAIGICFVKKYNHI